jgi:hypothetical protein
LLLAKEEIAVGDDIELTLLARDDLGLVRRLLVQLGRETRSPAVITVSDGAVEDFDLHPAETIEGLGLTLLTRKLVLSQLEILLDLLLLSRKADTGNRAQGSVPVQ